VPDGDAGHVGQRVLRSGAHRHILPPGVAGGGPA
jgi:hypothetical protein